MSGPFFERTSSRPADPVGMAGERHAPAHRPMVLIQPPSQGRVSGGYLFNREMLWRLQRDGLGETLTVRRGELHTVPTVGGRFLLLDSLYLNDRPWTPGELGAHPERSTGLLIHYVPSSSPELNEDERARMRMRERAWLDNVDRVITTSRVTAKHAAAHASVEARIVQPGVSDDFRRSRRGPPPGSPLQLVSVGNVCAGKNQRFTLDCLARSETKNFVWHLVGDTTSDPDYVTRLEEEARLAGIGDRLRLWGTLDHADIASLFDEAHLYISASRFESYGMATAEAVCHGIPTVCFDVGASSEWVHHGRNGLIYQPEDPTGFAHGLARVLTEARSLHALESDSHDPPLSQFPSWEQSYDVFVNAVFGSER